MTQSTDTSLSDYSSISSDETDESMLAQPSNSSSRGAKRARMQQRAARRGRGVRRGRGARRGRGVRRGRGTRRGRGASRGRGARTGSNIHSVGSTVDLVGAATSVLDPLSETIWQKKEPTSFSRNYMLTPGPTTPVDSSISAVDLFCRFFTDEVWDLIVF